MATIYRTWKQRKDSLDHAVEYRLMVEAALDYTPLVAGIVAVIVAVVRRVA